MWQSRPSVIIRSALLLYQLQQRRRGGAGRGGSGWDAAAAALQLEKKLAQQRLAQFRGGRGGCLRCFHAVIFTGRDPEMLCVMCFFFFNPLHPPREKPRSGGAACGEVFMTGESPRCSRRGGCPPVMICQPFEGNEARAKEFTRRHSQRALSLTSAWRLNTPKRGNAG